MFHSLGDVLQGIHDFFEHLTAAGDVHDHVSSTVDLHQQIADYAGGHTLLPDDVTSIMDAFTQHHATLAPTLAQHLADTAHHGFATTSVETGRHAARNALKLLGQRFGSGACPHCGGTGMAYYPSSGTVTVCGYCHGSGVA
jgi:hypothetical protein